MSRNPVSFARLCAAASNPLAALHFTELWSTADTETLQLLAARAELPTELHKLAAEHPAAQVRASYCNNPEALPALLVDMIGREDDASVVAALFRAENIPDEALVDRLHEDPALVLMALGRRRREGSLRLAAFRYYASSCDALGHAAAAQLKRMIGEDDAVWEAAVSNAGSAATALVLAAGTLAQGSPELRDEVLLWLERNGHAALGEAHTDVLNAAAAVGEHPQSTHRQRERVLAFLGGHRSGLRTEILQAWHSGTLLGQIETSHGAAQVVSSLGELQDRVAHQALAPLLAKALTNLGPLWQSASVQHHIRGLYNPLLGLAIESIPQEGDTTVLYNLSAVVGCAFLDHCQDPWSKALNLPVTVEQLLVVRAFREDPRRTLSVLRPLAVICRQDRIFADTAIKAVLELPDTQAAHTASVLFSEWEGTLDELLEAAQKLI